MGIPQFIVLCLFVIHLIDQLIHRDLERITDKSLLFHFCGTIGFCALLAWGGFFTQS